MDSDRLIERIMVLGERCKDRANADGMVLAAIAVRLAEQHRWQCMVCHFGNPCAVIRGCRDDMMVG